MAKVPLRKYNSEIEALIDRGQTDEAIAHCRHILKTFPKYLETYRLLGKAYLESRRHADAMDIFERILMAVPDDFVSHVGVSIIADEQKRLDDAIWHMERAFEKQPSNAAIQAELQRLYGRRDGMEPPKIRLTRGALAHMYVQGDLYPQAVAEIRLALAEEPGRTDMQALLALAHFRGGQKVDASEICSQLLVQYPYCLDANRILVEILPGTGMAENVQTYRQRVIELEPYAAFTSGSIFLAGEVPESSITIDRLDYRGQTVEAPPAWGGSSSSGAPAAQPDWMKIEDKKEPVSPFAQASDFSASGSAAQDESFSAESGSSAPDVPIPEWMREAGWGESSGTFDESAVSSVNEGAEAELSKADLPDWIKSMAPVEPQSSVAPSSDSSAVDDTMDWLNKLSGDTPFSETAPETPSAPTPDWLSDLDKETPPPAAPAVPPPAPAAPAPAGLDASLGDLGTSAAEQDAAMLWLESLAAKQGANSEELITNPDERLDKPPEWVEQARMAGEPQSAVQPISENLPLEEVQHPVPATDIPSEPTTIDQTGVWLRDLEEKDNQLEKPVEAEPVAWSGEIELSPSPAARPVAESSAHEADLPTWLRGLEVPETAAATASDDMPNWLKDEESEVPPPPAPTQPADWTPETAQASFTPPASTPAATPEPYKKTAPKPELKPKAKVEMSAPADKAKVKRTGMLPPLVDPGLASARDALSRGEIPVALQSYGTLIRKGKLLEDITFDLKEALYRFPVEVSIWQALGDVYMRANRLQDALDAYTKAEELLR